MQPTSITLRQLECLGAVVNHRSISAAARTLHVTPGAVSLAIDELEGHLGVQLFIRARGRGVEITAAGREVYSLAQEIEGKAQEISRVAASLNGELTGPLRLGVFSTLSPWFLPRIAEHISRNYPSIQLELREDGSRQIQDALLTGKLDAAILYRNHLVPGVEGTDITPVKLQLAVAPTHRLAAQETVYLQDLEEENGALLAIQPASDHVEQLLRKAGMVPRIKWRSSNVETIRSLVARGLAYTVIMGRPYGDVTYDGLPITYRTIADKLPDNSVVFSSVRGMQPTANVNVLRSFCITEFSPHDEDITTQEMGRIS